MSRCSFDPRRIKGAVGMMHCPECGQMVLAGVARPDYDEFDRHLGRMAALGPGDLVGLEDGLFAIVLEDTKRDDGEIRVAIGNGLEAYVPWTRVQRVHTLSRSDAHVNFVEWLRPEILNIDPMVQRKTPEESP